MVAMVNASTRSGCYVCKRSTLLAVAGVRLGRLRNVKREGTVKCDDGIRVPERRVSRECLVLGPCTRGAGQIETHLTFEHMRFTSSPTKLTQPEWVSESVPFTDKSLCTIGDL